MHDKPETSSNSKWKYGQYKNTIKIIKISTSFSIDKDSPVAILNKIDFIEKLENMVIEGIDKGLYTLTEDNTIKDLKNFKQFLE